MNVACMNEGVIIVNKWYTVNQVAEKTGIPAETVRRYVRQYKDYLLTNRGERRSYLIHETSIEAIERIRYLLDHGHQRQQIENTLQQTETTIIQTDNEDMKNYLQTLPELHKTMIEQVEQLNEKSDKQEQIIQSLVEQLHQQEQRIIERDEHIMKLMNELIEDKKRLAESEKKGFFRDRK